MRKGDYAAWKELYLCFKAASNSDIDATNEFTLWSIYCGSMALFFFNRPTQAQGPFVQISLEREKKFESELNALAKSMGLSSHEFSHLPSPPWESLVQLGLDSNSQERLKTHFAWIKEDVAGLSQQLDSVTLLR